MTAGGVSTGGRTRRWSPWACAALLALAVSACGGGSELTRIPLGGTGGVREASGDALAISMLYPGTFVLADGVDVPASDAEAWRWDAPGVDDVVALAGRLGVTGSPVEFPAAEGGGWLVGDPSTGASLSVAPSGAWSANSERAAPTVVSSDGCIFGLVVDVEPPAAEGGPVVTTVDDSSVCGDALAESPPVLPTDDQVLASAAAIFGDGAEVGVDWRDDWSVSVRAEYLVDNGVSGQAGYYAAYGSGWYASGILGAPVSQGRYPTISAADAVARLTDSPLGLGLVAPAGDVMTDAVGGDVVQRPTIEPGGDPASGTEPMPGAAESVPAEPELMPEPMPEPMPLPEPVPEPQLVEILLVSAAPTLVPFFDGTGRAWSLPGYVYTDADGGEWEVVAVSDEYFDEPVQVPGDGAVDPPADGDGSPGSDDGGAVVGPGGGVVEPFPGQGGSGGSGPGPGEDPPDVVGLAEADATAKLEGVGFGVRIAERDGEAFMLTKDYRSDRVNLVIAGGVVTSVWTG